MFIKIKVFLLGFWEGKGECGMTYPNDYLNEAYDWGRSLRRMSRTN